MFIYYFSFVFSVEITVFFCDSFMDELRRFRKLSCKSDYTPFFNFFHSGNMALWVDKYRPQKLAELSYHLDQADQLKEVVASDDFPHLLVYGPNGAGKATRIRCILRALYGAGAARLRMDTKAFTTPGGKKLEIQTVSSNYHIELSPGDVGVHDRVVVQEVIKQMAQTSQLNEQAQKDFKVVVLKEVDTLSRDAQHALRRTMENYSGNCRLILCCESLSRVIDPLRSRCMMVRVAAPTDGEVASVLKKVGAEEKVDIPDEVMEQILNQSRGNLRRALLLLEGAKTQHYPLTEWQKIPQPEWEAYLRETAGLILHKQTADALQQVRERLYEVLSRCIPPNIIFVYLIRLLLPHSPPSIKSEVISVAAEFEHRLTKGQKAIFHLEAFVAAFMEMYNRAKMGGSAMEM